MGGILVAGLLAGFGIAVQVGAITVLIMTLSAHHSLRVGLAAGMGTATADGIFALLAATAGAGIAALLRPIDGPMRWTAAAVLVLLAAKGVVGAVRLHRTAATEAAEAAAATDAAEAAAVAAAVDAPDSPAAAEPGTGPEAEGPVRRRPLGAYLQLLGLTLLNPLTIIYFSVLVLGLHNGSAWSVADAAVFVLATVAASAGWQAVLALGGALIGRALTGARGRLASALVGNAVIALLAVRLVVG